MDGQGKRPAEAPRAVRLLAKRLSKNDLLEAAWHLASLCNQGEGCDDDPATLTRLIDELNILRAGQGRPVLTPRQIANFTAALLGDGRRDLDEGDGAHGETV